MSLLRGRQGLLRHAAELLYIRKQSLDSVRYAADRASENDCQLITAKEMQIIKDKRAKDKNKK